jgi:hypothetical protein
MVKIVICGSFQRILCNATEGTMAFQEYIRAMIVMVVVAIATIQAE